MCQSTFRLKKYLKRLHFKGSYSDFKQLDSNKLTHLEQLRLDVQYDCNPDGEEIAIDLPNLKILEIGEFEDQFDIYLTAPELEMLKHYEYHMLNLTYPETVVHLETTFHTEPLTDTSLKNLQYLIVDSFRTNRFYLRIPNLTHWFATSSIMMATMNITYQWLDYAILSNRNALNDMILRFIINQFSTVVKNFQKGPELF